MNCRVLISLLLHPADFQENVAGIKESQAKCAAEYLGIS